MTEQVKNKTDTEDEILVAVNNKVEEWKVGRDLTACPSIMMG